LSATWYCLPIPWVVWSRKSIPYNSPSWGIPLLHTKSLWLNSGFTVPNSGDPSSLLPSIFDRLILELLGMEGNSRPLEARIQTRVNV
jgi:hypothetical protein